MFYCQLFFYQAFVFSGVSYFLPAFAFSDVNYFFYQTFVFFGVKYFLLVFRIFWCQVFLLDFRNFWCNFFYQICVFSYVNYFFTRLAYFLLSIILFYQTFVFSGALKWFCLCMCYSWFRLSAKRDNSKTIKAYRLVVRIQYLKYNNILSNNNFETKLTSAKMFFIDFLWIPIKGKNDKTSSTNHNFCFYRQLPNKSR